MPKLLDSFNFDYNNRAELLHAQAYATYLLIASMPNCGRINRLTRKAQERSARRFKLAFGGK